MRELKTSDLYKMSKILKKMDIKFDIKPGTSQEQAGAEIILRAAENLYLAQKEVNEFLGGLVGITGEEFDDLPISESLKYIDEFKSLPGVMGFLKSAGQSTK